MKRSLSAKLLGGPRIELNVDFDAIRRVIVNGQSFGG
jgi:hypothetical protein